ncbi:hypothetical protein [Chlorogloeopsis fritschii]
MVSHCGGRVSRHKASGEPEGQKGKIHFHFFVVNSAHECLAPVV